MIDHVRRGRQRPVRVAALLLLLAALLPGSDSAQGSAPYMPLQGAPASSAPADLVADSGIVYFFATEPATGRELWKSDGTACGTSLVRDVNPGPASAWQDRAPGKQIAIVNHTLFFAADDGAHGYELWRSDGTEAGTTLVYDINPGVGGSNILALTPAGDHVYFVADDGAHGAELWRSDGADTRLVADVRPGPASAFGLEAPAAPFPELAGAGGQLFFAADDGVHGRELWASDGSAAGTVLVADIQPGQVSSAPDSVVAAGPILFFSADDGRTGSELWKSDGTVAGTQQVRDINPGPIGSGVFKGFWPNRLALGQRLFFAADDGVHGAELWQSDGTPAGTTLVRDLAPGADASSPLDLVAMRGILYFGATTSEAGQELWRSDGTAGGTSLVRDSQPGAGTSWPANLTPADGILFLSSAIAPFDHELWRSDGTAAGTQQVTDINPDGGALLFSSAESYLTNVNGQLLFSADDGARGVELWRSDGSAAGTVLVRDINPSAPVACAGSFAVAAGTTLAATLRAAGSAGAPQPLTYSILSMPAKGTLTLIDPATGSFTYSPAPGASGLDSFAFRADGGLQSSNTATVTVLLGSDFIHLPVVR